MPYPRTPRLGGWRDSQHLLPNVAPWLQRHGMSNRRCPPSLLHGVPLLARLVRNEVLLVNKPIVRVVAFCRLEDHLNPGTRAVDLEIALSGSFHSCLYGPSRAGSTRAKR